MLVIDPDVEHKQVRLGANGKDPADIGGTR